MLLTITSTTAPATDLGYLLYKNPARVQSFELAFGKAHVLYPEATPERCTAALLLDLDPVHLVRGQHGAAEQYVNDRPYVASSFMSVALAQVYGTAMAGRCKDRPELAATAMPYTARLAVVQCRGGESILRRLFEPLGYTVQAEPHLLDEHHPDWGPSEYFTVTLTGTVRLSELLAHLYVLLPVLDAEKHYWIGDDEVEKLVRFGEGWLSQHPERELIARRYLKHRHLIRAALAQLTEEDAPDPDAAQEAHAQEEAEIEEHMGLNEQRLGAVLAVLKGASAQRVLDLGCGEGRLLQLLIHDKSFIKIVGVDVSHRALEVAAERLHLEEMPAAQRERVQLLHSALTYRDERLAGYDAAALVEVLEHLDAARLAALERVVFEFAQPRLVVCTTPNVEYNVKMANLPQGELRHRDHRFEWTRAEFQSWAMSISVRYGYNVRFLPVGTEDPALGAPTQMAVFTK
jgi:3' terminal RNA ribose 2'-O-methyltransferase Hen1